MGWGQWLARSEGIKYAERYGLKAAESADCKEVAFGSQLADGIGHSRVRLHVFSDRLFFLIAVYRGATCQHNAPDTYVPTCLQKRNGATDIDIVVVTGIKD